MNKIMKYEDFKELFEKKFYSIEDNRIVEWQVEKVMLCNYNRDEYDNLCPIYNGNLDVEFVVKDKNSENDYYTVDKNKIGKEFFTSITDLVNHIMPE